MFCTLELYQDNDGINLILTKFFHRADVDVNEAVLVVGNDVPDRSVCCALEVTAPSFEIDKNIVSNALETKLIQAFLLDVVAFNIPFQQFSSHCSCIQEDTGQICSGDQMTASR